MSNVEAIKKADNAPDRIWATVNGMSTRYPDGSRQLIGGWQQDAGRDGSVEYVRASTLEALQRENGELRKALEEICDEDSYEKRESFDDSGKHITRTVYGEFGEIANTALDSAGEHHADK